MIKLKKKSGIVKERVKLSRYNESVNSCATKISLKNPVLFERMRPIITRIVAIAMLLLCEEFDLTLLESNLSFFFIVMSSKKKHSQIIKSLECCYFSNTHSIS